MDCLKQDVTSWTGCIRMGSIGVRSGPLAHSCESLDSIVSGEYPDRVRGS
jgi:hypothetical protein